MSSEMATVQAMKALKNVSLTKAKLLQYSGMRRWLYAVSNAQKTGKQLNIVCAIDSLTAGAGGSSYVDYFRPLVQGVLGDGGLGFVAFNETAINNEYKSFNNYGKGGTPSPTSHTNANGYSSFAPNLFDIVFANGVTSGFITLADNVNIFNTATIYGVTQSSGGSFKFGDYKYQPGMHTINTASETPSIISDKYVGFPSTTGNTIFVNGFTGGSVQLLGVDFARNAPGSANLKPTVRVHRLAQGGTKCNQVANLDAGGYTSFLQSVGCDLFIINAGMNDRNTFSPSQFNADLTKILTNVRNANPNCAILIVGMNDAALGSDAPLLQAFRVEMQKIAEQFEALYIDNRWIMGTYANANSKGWMTGDGVHPTTAVNPLLAQNIFNSIGGQYLSNVDQLLLS